MVGIRPIISLFELIFVHLCSENVYFTLLRFSLIPEVPPDQSPIVCLFYSKPPSLFSHFYTMQIQCLVKPKSKVDQVTVSPDGSLRVKIKALPEDGKANNYLVKYLAEVFDVSQSSIQIVSGFTNSHKRLNIVVEETMLKAKLNKLRV